MTNAARSLVAGGKNTGKTLIMVNHVFSIAKAQKQKVVVLAHSVEHQRAIYEDFYGIAKLCSEFYDGGVFNEIMWIELRNKSRIEVHYLLEEQGGSDQTT